PDISPVVYVLSVLSHDYTFEQVDQVLFRTPLLSPSAVTMQYPIILRLHISNSCFKPCESFSSLGVFQNPMMMMMIVLLTTGMMLATPYIMKNLNSQSLEGIKNRRAKVTSIQSSMQNGSSKSRDVTILKGLSERMNQLEPRLSAFLTVEGKTKASTSGANSHPNNSGTTMPQRKVGKGGKRQ
ncbi:hypothetical protein EDC04DRAFT_2574050, partial [Pisolithus marmoratus]